MYVYFIIKLIGISFKSIAEEKQMKLTNEKITFNLFTNFVLAFVFNLLFSIYVHILIIGLKHCVVYLFLTDVKSFSYALTTISSTVNKFMNFL